MPNLDVTANFAKAKGSATGKLFNKMKKPLTSICAQCHREYPVLSVFPWKTPAALCPVCHAAFEAAYKSHLIKTRIRKNP